MRRRIAAAALAPAATAATVTVAATPVEAARPLTNVLVFSKTAGFRHDAIPAGIDAIRQLGRANGFTVTATEDANHFTPSNLARCQAVVWLSTIGDVLDTAQQNAFQSYIAAGGDGVRPGVPDSDLRRQQHVDDRPLDDHR